MAASDLPLLTFVVDAEFEAWLAAQPEASPGAWLRFAKQGAAQPTIRKTDAIDCALADGWIDGQLGPVDDQYFKTRFTPRKPRSAWSRINRERAERLIEDEQVGPLVGQELADEQDEGAVQLPQGGDGRRVGGQGP